MEADYQFLSLLLIVAFLYSSVGHGGASGYLALMALFSFSPAIMKSSALILNIFVSGVSFFQFYKGGYFKLKLFYPFVLTSIPLAFLGASITVDPLIYKRILGVLLLFPVLRLLGIFGKTSEGNKPVNMGLAIFIGGVIGFFSGMIGIGGGIILSPIIVLLHWGDVKQTAAVSALFIFVNSVSGLLGLMYSGFEFNPQIYNWIIIAFVGGLLGAFAGRSKFTHVGLTRMLAVVLFIASLKLMMT